MTACIVGGEIGAELSRSTHPKADVESEAQRRRHKSTGKAAV